MVTQAMSIGRLVLREIWFRKLGFALAVLAVAVAVGSLVGQVLLLGQHDLRTEQILAQKETATQESMAKLEDEIRKITKNMGFNLRILPKDVQFYDFLAKDYADKYMPEKYAQDLAKARIITINHLAPTLEQKTAWPEQRLPALILVGTRGEVPILSQDKKKPILQPVPQGGIVLGYELRRDFKVGDTLTLHRRSFKVHKIHPQRGDTDDLKAWVHLQDAQELLDKKGLINGMLALGCNCTADRLSVIRQEIMNILPDTQVVEFETKALARAEARNLAAATAKAAIEQERQNRLALRGEKEAFAAALVPVVLLGACVWLGLLALGNVRERRGEIGLLRALGLRSGQLFALFLSRAALVGLVGAALGCIAGVAMASFLGEWPEETWNAALVQAPLFGAIVLAAPLVSALACWLPALLAVKQDPAVVLQRETAGNGHVRWRLRARGTRHGREAASGGSRWP